MRPQSKAPYDAPVLAALLITLAALSTAAPVPAKRPTTAPAPARPGSNFLLSLGIGKSDIGAAYRLGLEAQMPRSESVLIGGRLAYGRDWRALGRFRTYVVTEPAVYYALHGGPMSLLAGAGAGIAYFERGTDAPCNDPKTCPPLPSSVTGTGVSLSASAGSLFRIGPFLLSLLVRFETVSLRGYALTLNTGVGFTLPR